MMGIQKEGEVLIGSRLALASVSCLTGPQTTRGGRKVQWLSSAACRDESAELLAFRGEREGAR